MNILAFGFNNYFFAAMCSPLLIQQDSHKPQYVRSTLGRKRDTIFLVFVPSPVLGRLPTKHILTGVLEKVTVLPTRFRVVETSSMIVWHCILIGYYPIITMGFRWTVPDKIVSIYLRSSLFFFAFVAALFFVISASL